MGDHHRVIVHVDDARVGVDLARDLVHRTLRGQPDADVEELVMPASAARNRTTRRRNRRFSTAARRSPGISASTCSAATRSASKLSLPPR